MNEVVAIFSQRLKLPSPRNRSSIMRSFHFYNKQRGQGMTEYIIIVALIAIAAIAVYQFFGSTVRNQTAAIAQELAGNDGTDAKKAAQDAAKAGAEEATVKRNLDTYTGNAAKGN
jgi:Flp pilus assembly pilin Flp